MHVPKLLGAVSVSVVALVGAGTSVATAAEEPRAAAAPTVVASAWSPRGEVAQVTCPAGTQLVGGGADARLGTNGLGQVTDDIEANAPHESVPNTWKVQLHDGQARAFAMCSPDAPTPTVVASAWSRDGEVARATCPEGTVLAGGGQDSRLKGNLFGLTDGVEANAPDESNPNTWKVQAHAGQARAFALCTPGTDAPTIVASAWSPRGGVAQATCPEGQQLVGGGADARLGTNGAGQVTDGIEANAPDETRANSWKVQLHNGQARAFAMCSPDAPTPTVVTSAWSRDGEVARATCPEGTQLIGGGQDARLKSNLFNVTDGVEANAPDEINPNTWKVQAHAGQARAFALCTP